MRELLTALQQDWKDIHFRVLCDVLEPVVPRLTDELVTELEGETGKQTISEAINQENGRIVFKEFGQEKRLSELEKKRLLALLNRKSQCTRDIWCPETSLSRLRKLVCPRTRFVSLHVRPQRLYTFST